MKTTINKAYLAATTFICLIPIAMYLLVYDRLPENMAQQWGIDGSANWSMSRQWAIFVLPALLAIVHIFVIFVTHNDPKRSGTSKAMQHFIYWIIPVTSLFTNIVVLFANLGADFDVGAVTLVFVGLIFFVVGNYLPKNRQNYTVGLRLPWTLNDADNWNKTHRLAGWLFMICGAIFILVAVLPLSGTALIILLAATIGFCVVVPSVYSFVLHKRAR